VVSVPRAAGEVLAREVFPASDGAARISDLTCLTPERTGWDARCEEGVPMPRGDAPRFAAGRPAGAEGMACRRTLGRAAEGFAVLGRIVGDRRTAGRAAGLALGEGRYEGCGV
jgi:hypothetical protein